MIQTPTADISLIDEHVLLVSVRDGMTIDVQQLWENFNATVELNPAADYPVIFETQGFVSITKEARELAASREMAKDVAAMALIVNTMATRILANFYLKVNKPMRPTRMFTDMQKAIEWCKEEYRKYLESKKAKG
jgi:hypothetical protein